MSAAQGFVGVGGVTLVTLNLIRDGKTRGQIMAGLTGKSVDARGHSAGTNSEQYIDAGKAMGKVALELVFVGALTFAAGLSRAWGTALAAVVVGLALLYAMNPPAGSKLQQTIAEQSGAAGAGVGARLGTRK